MNKKPNALIDESSPYLLQHAHNPVDWHPWHADTLKRAQQENKLLIISIGYAACHWCHVMEHECFEDREVAQLMNKHFICIKVDREERPDVDSIYMNACQLISGRGGWPLNAFALPDGRPFYAGTYFPKPNWMDLMQQIIQLNATEPQKLERSAEQIQQGIASTYLPSGDSNNVDWEMNDFDHIWQTQQQHIDFQLGGQMKAPKFPMPSIWEYLLHYHAMTKNNPALQAAHTTLTVMARGGIFDQLGGGFARYSTDEQWFAPHFEKMLYDNAQLVSLYAHAFQQSKNPFYEEVIRNTLSFIERELSSPDGAFYSSLDADTEGEEGKFYVWKRKEIEEILDDDAALFCDFYGVEEGGNWEKGQNILFHSREYADLALQYNVSETDLRVKIEHCKSLLMQARNKRTRPGLDDKILVSWNALMIQGYVDASLALGDASYLTTALRAANYLFENMMQPDGSLLRNLKPGRTKHEGMLDDYALVIAACLSLFQSTFNMEWLSKAQKLTDYCLNHFWDDSTTLFYYTHHRVKDLITRSREISDNVIPSSNALMAHNLLTLSHLLDDVNYSLIADQMLQQVTVEVKANPLYHALWCRLALMITGKPFELAVVGEDYQEMMQNIRINYLPQVFFTASPDGQGTPLVRNRYKKGQTMAYICQDKVCGLPISNVNEIIQTLQ